MPDIKCESSFSKSDCEKIISIKLQTDNFTVLDFEQLSFEKVRGFLGEHSTLLISVIVNDTQENHKFFVKSLPKVKSQRNFVLEINGFFKEHFFFTKYLHLLNQHSITVLGDIIPTCLHTDGENFVFEDLAVRGYTTLQARSSLDVLCARAALKSLAKLHASGIILEEKSNFRLNEEFEEEFAESFHADKSVVKAAYKAARSGFEVFIDLTHNSDMKLSKEYFKTKCFQGLDQQRDFVKPSKSFRNTICHADLWTNNIMFKFDKENVNCTIIDFQSYRYGPPAQDVIAFLHLTTDKQFRKSHMKKLLKFYYGELDSNFKKFGFEGIISEEEFFTSCQYYQQFALTQACTHFQVVAMSEEIAADLLSDEDKALYVLFENKFDFVIKACEKDDIYRRMNFDALSELREFYEQQQK